MLQTLPSVEQVKQMSPFEIADMMWGDDNGWETFAYPTNENASAIIELINGASCNPYFRIAVSNPDSIRITDKLCLLQRANIMGTNPDILCNLHKMNAAKLNFLRRTYVLQELDLLNEICKNSRFTGEDFTLRFNENISLVVPFVAIWNDLRLKQWYDAYIREYSKVTDSVTDDLIYNGKYSYAYFWDYLREKFGFNSNFPEQHLTDVTRFSPKSFDWIGIMCDNSRHDHQEFLCGDGKLPGIIRDLDIIYLAVNAKKAGRKFILLNVDPDDPYNMDTDMMCRFPVLEILNKERLHGFITGYATYMDYVMCNVGKYNESLAWYLEQLPENYESIIEYIADNVARPEERIKMVVGDKLAWQEIFDIKDWTRKSYAVLKKEALGGKEE